MESREIDIYLMYFVSYIFLLQISICIYLFYSQATVEDLLTNKKYSLKVAGHTKSIFSQMTRVGNFSEIIYFELQGKTFVFIFTFIQINLNKYSFPFIS